MVLYKFYDANMMGTELYDISGLRYKRLLEACFRYCASVTMCVHLNSNVDLHSVEHFRRKITPTIKAQYAHYGSFDDDDMDVTHTYRLVRYLLTPEVKRLLMDRADGIFKWTYAWGNENPEDLAFFRPDGTVFFSSVVREGECTLHPEDGEDISLILRDPRWIAVEE